MKKFCTFILFFLVLTITGCSAAKEKLNPEIAEELENYKWEYYSTDTTYEATYESDYWNGLDNRYEKMFYEAAVNADFSKEMQKHIYLFYGEEVDDYSWNLVCRAIQFARLDHPELELMNMDFSHGLYSSGGETLYQSTTFYSMEYDQYDEKLEEVNSEIKDLVELVNNTEDIIEKHRLIFDWITSNVTFMETEDVVGIVDFYNDEYILGRTSTDTTQNIYGAIVNKIAICDGIADAYKYICNMCNMECIIVDGYISDFSEGKYHAWNLVKVDETWYLVDATWQLGDDSNEYFMVKDLNKGQRTPFNIGCEIPGYNDQVSNQVKFKESNQKNVLTTDDGMTLEMDRENYLLCASDTTIYILLSELGMERYLDGDEEILEKMLIKTNAQITRIEYFDYSESLIRIAENLNCSEFIFSQYIDETYITSVYVYLSYGGNTYRVQVIKSGA